MGGSDTSGESPDTEGGSSGRAGAEGVPDADPSTKAGVVGPSKSSVVGPLRAAVPDAGRGPLASGDKAKSAGADPKTGGGGPADTLVEKVPADAAAGGAARAEGSAAGSAATDSAIPAGTSPADGKNATAASKDEAIAGKDDATAGKGEAVAGKGGTAAGKGETASGDGTADGTTTAGAAGGAAAAAAGGSAASRKTGRTWRFRPVAGLAWAGRGIASWARGPSGRVVIPGVLVAGLVVTAVASGAYLVPKALEAGPAPSLTPQFGDGALGSGPPWGAEGALPPSYPVPGAGATGLPGVGTGLPGVGTGLPGVGTGLPGVGGTGLPGFTQPAAANARPADALVGWAEQVGTKVGIPVVAVQAYGYAELVAAQTTPACRLSWTTLAAIGKVESSHGSYNGAVLRADGGAEPTIYGLPLDGKGGRALVADTDRGVLDGDVTFDRAIGPMQFLPATWQANAIDADRDGVANPNDIDDATLTAAVYLCKGGRDMSRADSWWEAILAYNAVAPYAQKVFTTADEYGRRSQS
ncbi:MAG TPA: lytic murein transglycosylase [Actinoplanes sp.]|nr:lytic murein transglycosylase [Actinoplanes sp.]